MPKFKSDIAQVAHKYGISLRTLRFYEEQGYIRPLRVAGRRAYSANDMVRIEIILTGKKLGFTLNEIARLLPSQTSDCTSRRPTEFVTEGIGIERLSDQIRQLEHQRNELDVSIKELRSKL